MCLQINSYIQKDLQDRFEKEPTIVCWKNYKINETQSYLSHQYVSNKSPITTWGVIKATDKQDDPVPVHLRYSEGTSGTVDYGIHVYLKEEQAKYALERNLVKVEVICRKEHLRAAGTNGYNRNHVAVFTEIEITEAEFRRVIGPFYDAPIEVGKTVYLLSRGGEDYIRVNRQPALVKSVTDHSVTFSFPGGVVWGCGRNWLANNYKVCGKIEM
jgi:hypothetical protein